MSEGLERFKSRRLGHGKHAPIEQPPPKARKAKRSEFIQVELEWATDMAKTLGTPGAVVWLVMRHLAWKAESPTFAFSNALLNKLGVDRRTKYRVLENLEPAGKIKFERRGQKKAPIVTLFKVPDRL